MLHLTHGLYEFIADFDKMFIFIFCPLSYCYNKILLLYHNIDTPSLFTCTVGYYNIDALDITMLIFSNRCNPSIAKARNLNKSQLILRISIEFKFPTVYLLIMTLQYNFKIILYIHKHQRNEGNNDYIIVIFPYTLLMVHNDIFHLSYYKSYTKYFVSQLSFITN